MTVPISTTDRGQNSSAVLSANVARLRVVSLLALLSLAFSSPLSAQSVCLPAPRLLTMMPMGGQVGSRFEVKVSGDYLDGVDQLLFSHRGITAEQMRDDNGQPVSDTFVISVADDCPTGIHDARVLTRLGVSSSRAFHVGLLSERLQVGPNTSTQTAMELDLNTVCNGVLTQRAIDHYSFEAEKGRRVVIDCAAKGIDSKLKPVLIVADRNGNDLLVQRRGGAIDFVAPESGRYIVKLHDLTYKGGPAYYYRLALREAAEGEMVARMPSVREVHAFSWPPPGLAKEASLSEAEPNDEPSQAQQITLPCDIAGAFYPAADADTYEFSAKKGEVWWVEVASHRLGRPTDPALVVQRVVGEGSDQTTNDLVEFSDIASPIKVSSNGYSYDGPPYNAGSTDIIGKIEIKEDGVHRIRIHDLFGGTRSDRRNIYRLVIRKPQPDFALVGWALHMNLRNGDRNALSKPLALRGGATMPIEVVVVRRDGFQGEIELFMEGLPAGVTASGVKIPEGKSRGIMLVSAAVDASRGFSVGSFYGRAVIDGVEVRRPCALASMSWPVPDASQEIPSPRLMADVPISVTEAEQAPLTIAPQESKVFEATVGQKLTIPLAHARRCDFLGANITLKTFGAGFEGAPGFEASLKAESSEAVLDLAALKPPPGEYVVAFYGSAVANYRYNLQAIETAQSELKKAEALAMDASVRATASAEAAKTSQANEKAQAEQADAAASLQDAQAVVAAAKKRLQAAEAKAKPKDIVDIIVSTPFTIRVMPAE